MIEELHISRIVAVVPLSSDLRVGLTSLPAGLLDTQVMGRQLLRSNILISTCGPSAVSSHASALAKSKTAAQWVWIWTRAPTVNSNLLHRNQGFDNPSTNLELPNVYEKLKRRRRAALRVEPKDKKPSPTQRVCRNFRCKHVEIAQPLGKTEAFGRLELPGAAAKYYSQHAYQKLRVTAGLKPGLQTFNPPHS